MYIYFLQGLDGVYIGITNNLKRRCLQHKHGISSTALARTGEKTKLVHYWNVSTRYIALKVETYMQAMQTSEGDSAVLALCAEFPLLPKIILEESLAIPDNGEQQRHKDL